MADNLSVARRSELMSRIKCRGTGPEVALEKLLRKFGMGVRVHPDLPGKPDMLVGGAVAVFVHGCFWHRCKEHFRLPKSRTEHWRQHIGGNVARHRKNSARLTRMGYRVVVVWEHELPRKKKGKALEAK